ncbi:MAG: SRPBCC family protein [Ignavibacteria bacterium]|nr:SRPBCC family protein [Ignavibacteria bacterium]
MGFYQFIRLQKIPASIDEIWDFISSPKNLKEITPEYMGFEITSKTPLGKMYSGMIISYKVKPIFRLKMTWVTEITHIKEKEYFVDEQRIGPYKMWHHEHKIEPIENGVLMTDIVSYKPPFGILGSLANELFIKKQLNEIFDYRRMILEKKFGKYAEN